MLKIPLICTSALLSDREQHHFIDFFRLVGRGREWLIKKTHFEPQMNQVRR